MYQSWFNFIAINENFVVICYSARTGIVFVLPMSSETRWCQCYANILWIQTQPQLVSTWTCLLCTDSLSWALPRTEVNMAHVRDLKTVKDPWGLHPSLLLPYRIRDGYTIWGLRTRHRTWFWLGICYCESYNLIFVFKPRPESFDKNKPWWCRSPGCWPLICILSAGPCPWFSGRVQCES